MDRKNCWNEYTSMSEDGTKLLDEFHDLLEDKIKEKFHEGFSRSDIIYAILSASDYIACVESMKYSTNLRKDKRK